MQTLGLSDSTVRTESRLKSLFWPSIQSGVDVDYLAVQGFWVCTTIGILSMIFLVLGRQPVTGLLVFLLFHISGVGVREHNPFAAAVILSFSPTFAQPGSLEPGRQIRMRLCFPRASEKHSSTKSQTNGQHSSGRKSRFCTTFFPSDFLSLLWRESLFCFCVAAPTQYPDSGLLLHLPMQKVLKMRFKISSAVVAPVIPSSGRKAL